mmetsp:Transcript_77640/g.222464  ORF Transcript_77640/g.222464 Transcript_77640/m.222464 type:complete len:491 (-) Transcript_77640:102-1574(-)
MTAADSCSAGDASVVPLRLPALLVPPPLVKSSEDAKKRIKTIESKLRSHRINACLGEEELQHISDELHELTAGLRASIAVEVDEEDKAEEGKTDGIDRRLPIKREIRDIEKQLKQLRKKPVFTNQEMAALGERLDNLKAELSEVQTRKPVILLWMRWKGEERLQAAPPAVKVALEDRISIVGLSSMQAASLLSCFAAGGGCGGAEAGGAADAGGGGCWEFRRHEGLRTAALHSRDAAALAQELSEVVAHSPHVVCVSSASLRARGGACAVLRAFQGALVIIEDEDEVDAEAVETACLLHAMGVKARWSIGPGSSVLEPAELPTPVQGEVMGDLKLRDAKEGPDMAPLFCEANALCLQEFHEDLIEVLSGDVVRVGLLVSCEPPLAFLGFITYKFWGPPLKAMSISRVAVPKKYQMMGFGRQLVRWAIEKAKQKSRFECDRVSLSAIPKAISFYARLNFVSVQGDDVPEEDGPNKDGAVRMEYSLGRASKR